MKNNYEFDKKRLQKHLVRLRGCAGLSAEALGKKVGMTKQAINYLENHPEKEMTKMQYVSIRAALEQEYAKNRDNINLRDCLDLVFSEQDFYEQNIERIDYALYQAVEDTKLQKRKNRNVASKNKENALVGATAMTIAAGGIASVAFPLLFPFVMASGTTMVAKKMKEWKQEADNVETGLGRVTDYINNTAWMVEAFESENSESQD